MNVTTKEQILTYVKKKATKPIYLTAYNEELESLSKGQLKRVFHALDYGSDTDIRLFFGSQAYVLECLWTTFQTYTELDLLLKPLSEYNRIYKGE